jgi:hypothetical protein
MEKYKEVTTEFGNEYVEWNDKGVIRYIPADPANSDYQRYLRWLENPDAEENGTTLNGGLN